MTDVCRGGTGGERQRRQGRSNGIHPTLSHVVAKGAPDTSFMEDLRNSHGKASVSSIRGSSHASHEPLCSLHNYAVCHRSHRFPIRARRELASVHVCLRPSSGEINPELGDCEGAGPIREATYRCPVTTAADALLMDGESTLCLCDRWVGSGSLSRMPMSQNRDMGHPILWRVRYTRGPPVPIDGPAAREVCFFAYRLGPLNRLGGRGLFFARPNFASPKSMTTI